MRTDIPGAVHAHVNATMHQAIQNADRITDTWKNPSEPQTRDEALNALATFIDTVATDAHYRWRGSTHFIAVPDWVRYALISHRVSDTITHIPGWDSPAPHSTADTWHVVAFLTPCSPLETILYTTRDWTQSIAYPCETRLLAKLDPQGATPTANPVRAQSQP